jgi:hypothetical protein
VWIKAQDSMIVTNRKMRPGLVPGRAREPSEHGADAGRCADDSQHQDGEAAFILSQRLPVDPRDVAAGNHPKREAEIERNADVQPTRMRVTPRNSSEYIGSAPRR